MLLVWFNKFIVFHLFAGFMYSSMQIESITYDIEFIFLSIKSSSFCSVPLSHEICQTIICLHITNTFFVKFTIFQRMI